MDRGPHRIPRMHDHAQQQHSHDARTGTHSQKVESPCVLVLPVSCEPATEVNGGAVVSAVDRASGVGLVWREQRLSRSAGASKRGCRWGHARTESHVLPRLGSAA